MHKAIVCLTVLLSLFLNADYPVEPKVPDYHEIPLPSEIYYPEYSFAEITATTNKDISTYFSFLDGFSVLKLYGLLGRYERRFIEIDFKRHSFKLSGGNISYCILLQHASDSTSGTLFLPALNFDNFVGKGFLSLKGSLAFFPERMGASNLSTLSYSVPEENFNWGVVSNWQRLDKPFNSHMGAYLEKDNIRYGIFYSRSFFPFLTINFKEKSPVSFEFKVDAVREVLLMEEMLFSSERTFTENMVCRSRYFGHAKFDFYSMSIKGRVYSDIDDIETYKDIGSLFYDVSISYKGKLKKLSYYSSVNVLKNEYSARAFFEATGLYEKDDLRIASSYKLCANERNFSHIVNFLVSLGTSSRRISFGVRNILSQYDCEENLYAPERTYFMNVILIHGSLFGKPK
ncbi:MAG: hypothetical protein PHW02_00720 [bacterium]|nr:hypothetical protein [bacterium]